MRCGDDHFHLHGREYSNWITLLNNWSNMDSHLYNHATHRGANLTWIARIGLRPGNILRSYILASVTTLDIPACLSSIGIERTSPFISKNTSRWPVFSDTGPTASNLIIKTYLSIQSSLLCYTLPFSNSMLNSSPISGLLKKYRVGRILRSPYFSTTWRYSS